MNRKVVSFIGVLFAAVGLISLGLYFTRGAEDAAEEKSAEPQVADATVQKTQPDLTAESDLNENAPIQQELNQLATKRVRELREEQRLNLNLGATLRSYQEMFNGIHTYAKSVESDLNLIEQISKDEFQEDVKQIAALFSGKKADLVAKHLEEFRAARVGAILSKMKDKEASEVLDTWAKAEDPKVSTFYREVMAAYLNNKRRDSHPELFKQVTDSSRAKDEAVR